jgi:type IV secretion system protein TrbD
MRQTLFFRVLHRPRLFLGGEREPTLMTAMVAGGLAVSGQNLVAIAIAAALWFGSIGYFRQMAKSDPQMTTIYIRHRKYGVYYPPRSRPYRGDERSPTVFYAVTAVGAALLLYWML